MLRAYFDASVIPEGVAAVAGYVASMRTWEQFDPAWKAVLDAYGLKYFHMTDWEAREEQFKDWQDDKRHDCFGRLVEVIRATRLQPVAFALLVSEYREVVAGYERVLSSSEWERFREPFSCCATNAIGVMLNRLKKNNINEPVACVFDQGDVGMRDVIEGYHRSSQASEEVRKRLDSVTTGHKEKFLGLQAADPLAFESAKHLLRRRGLTSRKVRTSAEILLRDAEPFSLYFDPPLLKKWIRGELGK